MSFSINSANQWDGKSRSLDETLAPISRVIAEIFFGEKYGRTLSQKIEDEQGIPKDKFHGMLIAGVIIGSLIWLDSRG